jgi:uncharacterized protein YbjT (DUF2867 family)
MPSRTAIIAGATGLVGQSCVRRLSSDPTYSQVVALVRKRSLATTANLIERVVRFDSLDLSDIAPGADVYCALGTTIRIAGSQPAFRHVDFGYVVELARKSAESGARQFAVVSSVGADASTRNFYLRTKGDMEAAISSMPFHAVHIFRPSLLLGNRPQPRPGERIAIALAAPLKFTLVGTLRKYRAIEADTVAAAMIAACREAAPGVHVHHYDDMRKLADRG